MTASAAQIGYGTTLQLGNGSSPEIFTDIAEVKDVSGFGVSLEQVEVTHLQSPQRKKEYIAGLGDGDSMTAKCNLTPANATILKDWIDAGLVSNFRLVFPGTLPGYQFAGSPEGWHPTGMTPSGVLEVEIGFKMTGAITELP